MTQRSTDGLAQALRTADGHALTRLMEPELTLLHTEVALMTLDLKADGSVPERVIVRLREIAADVGVTEGPLMDRVIVWAIEAYFD